MRVYAESNLVLELVLDQEQCGACEALLALGERRSIELVLPAFALLEPYQTIERRRIDNDQHLKWLDHMAGQLGRSASRAPDVSRLRDVSELMLRAAQDARDRYRAVRTRLLDVAHIIPIDSHVLHVASLLSADVDLTLPDALVLASVLEDARARPAPSLLANRNTQDFGAPDVVSRLLEVGCTVIGRFDDALARVQHLLLRGTSGR